MPIEPAMPAASSRGVHGSMRFAVVGPTGDMVYFEKMDGTQIASIDIAQFKARSAIGFKRSTKELGDRLAEGATYLLKAPWAAPFEGGVPLVVGGELVGAIAHVLKNLIETSGRDVVIDQLNSVHRLLLKSRVHISKGKGHRGCAEGAHRLLPDGRRRSPDAKALQVFRTSDGFIGKEMSVTLDPAKRENL